MIVCHSLGRLLLRAWCTWFLSFLFFAFLRQRKTLNMGKQKQEKQEKRKKRKTKTTKKAAPKPSALAECVHSAMKSWVKRLRDGWILGDCFFLKHFSIIALFVSTSTLSTLCQCT